MGGALIFGISDDEQIVGLGNPQGDAEKDKEIIKTRLTPIPEFRLRFEQVNGKILIIWIFLKARRQVGHKKRAMAASESGADIRLNAQ